MKKLFFCPQCGGLDTDEFVEGHCIDCYKENQKELNEFNYNFDIWNKMTDKQKEDIIKKNI